MTTYEQMGIAALLPGIQYALDQLQKHLDNMRETLGALQNGKPRPKSNRGGWSKLTREQRTAEAKRRAMKALRKKNEQGSKHSETQKSYWASMTAEQRSAEMRRRVAIAKKNRKEAA